MVETARLGTTGTGIPGWRYNVMQISIPEQAVRMRTLAAELRNHAAHTVLPGYQDKFERTAEELEIAAIRLERQSNRAH